MDKIVERSAQEPSAEYDVIVVGGGLAGLAFVLGLREAGLRVAVVDRQVQFDERILNFGNDLQPNALLALDSLGLLEEVKQLGALHRYWFADEMGSGNLAGWDYAMLDHPHPYAICIRPHLLRGLLRDRVTCMPGVDMLIPAEFISFAVGDRWHQVNLKFSGKDLVAKTRLLVGSDGPNSRVRTAAGIKADVRFYSHGWVDTIMARQQDEVTEGHVYFGPYDYLGIVPTRTNELVTFHLTSATSQAEYRQQFGSIEEFRRRYTQMAPILKNCIENVRSWDQAVYTKNLRVRAERWIANGVALAGDAAVSVNAITSQGACLALEGGVRLASVVRRAFERGDLSAHSLTPYQAWSKSQAEMIQDLGDLNLSVFTSRNPILSKIKLRMFRRLDSKPHLKHRILAYSCGLHWMVSGKLNWRDGFIGAGLWPDTHKWAGNYWPKGFKLSLD